MQSVASDVLSPHEKLLIDQTVAQHEGHPGALLGILETVQAADAHKFLSMESLRYIAEETGVPPAGAELTDWRPKIHHTVRL